MHTLLIRSHTFYIRYSYARIRYAYVTYTLAYVMHTLLIRSHTSIRYAYVSHTLLWRTVVDSSGLTLKSCAYKQVFFFNCSYATHTFYHIRCSVTAPLGSVFTEREREREPVFSSWNSLVTCRRTVQIECEREREHFFVRANDHLDCPQSEFCQMFARPSCY